MKFEGLKNLLIESPPSQFKILENLLEVFSREKALRFAFVRGSVARNDYDRASDVDLVIGIDDLLFEPFVNSLNFLMEEHFNPLMPGWSDKIVPNFGGLGYVYLIPENGVIFQVDLYVVPTTKFESVKAIPRAKQVYGKTDQDTVLVDAIQIEKNEKFISQIRSVEQDTEFYIIEILILVFLILKRIKRDQQLLNYSETNLLNNALRNLFRHLFEPHLLAFGWYHFMESNTYPNYVLNLKKNYTQEVVARSISDKNSLRSSLDIAKKLIVSQDTLLSKFSYTFEVFENLLKEG